jgi:hypothetical protein
MLCSTMEGVGACIQTVNARCSPSLVQREEEGPSHCYYLHEEALLGQYWRAMFIPDMHCRHALFEYYCRFQLQDHRNSELNQ